MNHLKLLLFVFVFVFVSCWPLWAYNGVTRTIEMHGLSFTAPSGSVVVPIEVIVLSTGCRPNELRAVFVPGFAHSAATALDFFQGLLENDVRPGRGWHAPLCEVALVNLPGKGSSGIPDASVYPFGALLEQQLAELVGGVLEIRGGADVLIAHSQGAELGNIIQTQLQERGSSLRQAYGVRYALWLNPVPLPGMSWQFVTRPEVVDLLHRQITYDEIHSDYVLAPDPLTWTLIYLSMVDGSLALGALSLEEFVEKVAAEGYRGSEPLLATLQLTRVDDPSIPPISIQPGIFAPRFGTLLYVVAAAGDAVVLEHEALEAGDALGAFDKMTVEGPHDWILTPELVDQLGRRGAMNPQAPMGLVRRP